MSRWGGGGGGAMPRSLLTPTDAGLDLRSASDSETDQDTKQ